MGHARWKPFKYFPHLSKCLLTIRHQRTWLCSSPLDVQSRILPLAAGLRSLLSWSPSDSPTGLLTKTHRHEIEANFNSTSIYNSCVVRYFVCFLKLHFITSLWPWHCFHLTLTLMCYCCFAYIITKWGPTLRGGAFKLFKVWLCEMGLKFLLIFSATEVQDVAKREVMNTFVSYSLINASVKT